MRWLRWRLFVRLFLHLFGDCSCYGWPPWVSTLLVYILFRYYDHKLTSALAPIVVR